MLSRVAERIYWIGRYLERTENTARLINVYANLLFDLPKGVPLGWELLPNIMGGREAYDKHYQKVDERNVIKFVMMDKSFSGSVLNSASSARENARTTREILPNEAWELINELNLFVNDNAASINARNKRIHFLVGLIRRCQHISGMLAGTMSRDVAYNFMIMGRNIERADMTSRILDTGAIDVVDPDDEFYSAYANILWLNVLDSLGAEQMFRKQVRERVDQKSVLNFLLQNRTYPRSITNCLEVFENALHSFPKHEATQRCISHTKLHLKTTDIASLNGIKLHEFLDELQMNFNNIHNEVASTWFSLDTQKQQQEKTT